MSLFMTPSLSKKAAFYIFQILLDSFFFKYKYNANNSLMKLYGKKIKKINYEPN